MANEYEEKISQVAKIFNAISDSYDNSGVDFFQPIAAGLVDALGTEYNEEWLDIGCGRGAVGLQAATKINRLIGIDISERMIENAAEMARINNLTNVEFKIDNAQNLQRISGSFDVIASCLVLFFLPDPLTALQNWRTFLKGSGRIGVTTFGSNDPGWDAIDALFQEYLPPKYLDARTSGTVGWFESDQSMERLLAEAGYSEVRTVQQTLPVRFESKEQWHDFTWSTGQRAMWMRIPEAERPLVREKMFGLLDTYVDSDGSITFYQGIRHTVARA